MRVYELDASEIFERGLNDPQSLMPEERLVYLVRELEILADMEGWDQFFVSTTSAPYFEEMKAGLSAVGDLDSLAVLNDYEHQLSEQGIVMEPAPLGRFLATRSDDYFANDRDWCEEFSDFQEQRWEKIRQYLSERGIRLLRIA